MNITKFIDEVESEQPQLVLWVIENGATYPLVFVPSEPTKPCGFTAEV